MKHTITVQFTIDPLEHGAEDSEDSAINLAIRILTPALYGAATFQCGDITRPTLPAMKSLLVDEQPHFEKTLHGMPRVSLDQLLNR